ncbi:Enolase 1, chloroplastic [Glycine soja]|uniref:phosphopyruvate hydratase n=1 Tax=Glycine soja TaxID=3848 RepID=A0A445I4E3_GLYSO|nr:Enolase 1, chloroplastic [Glycine soja]
MAQKENLMIFQGGEDLTICHILDAPSEVIGKSNYGTLYKALLQRSNKVSLLRFLKLMCTARGEELDKMIHFLGRIRNPNLVPLLGFYTGPRGEKLLLHPFYRHESLTQFIRGKLPLFLSHPVWLSIEWSVATASSLEYSAMSDYDDQRNQVDVDAIMLEIDGTPNKSKLGANAILGVFAEFPAFNVINGGSHAGNNLAMQEFMILPVGATSFAEALRMGSEVYHVLKGIIKEKYVQHACNVGDEGGFSPNVQDNRKGLVLLMDAIEKAGYTGFGSC